MKTEDTLKRILEEQKINISSSKQEKILHRIESSLKEINNALESKGLAAKANFSGINMVENEISWTILFEIKESHFIN